MCVIQIIISTQFSYSFEIILLSTAVRSCHSSSQLQDTSIYLIEHRRIHRDPYCMLTNICIVYLGLDIPPRGSFCLSIPLFKKNYGSVAPNTKLCNEINTCNSFQFFCIQPGPCHVSNEHKHTFLPAYKLGLNQTFEFTELLLAEIKDDVV